MEEPEVIVIDDDAELEEGEIDDEAEEVATVSCKNSKDVGIGEVKVQKKRGHLVKRSHGSGRESRGKGKSRASNFRRRDFSVRTTTATADNRNSNRNRRISLAAGANRSVIYGGPHRPNNALTRRRRTISSSLTNRRAHNTPKTESRAKEPTYEDLLNTYRQIQLQLQNLEEKDRDGAQSEKTTGDKENLDKNRRLQVKIHAKSLQYSPKTLASAQPCADEAPSQQEIAKTEEEDDETELRKLALASAMRSKMLKDRVNANAMDAPHSPDANNTCEILKSQDVMQQQDMTSKHLVGGSMGKTRRWTLNGLEDNYEEVSMDIDSSPESPKGKTTPEATTATNSDVDSGDVTEFALEEDEDLLRAVLLRGLADKVSGARNLNNQDQPVNSSTGTGAKFNDPSPAVVSPTRKVFKTAREVPARYPQRFSPNSSSQMMEHTLPRIPPLVINLQDDSDSEAEVPMPGLQVLNSITELLKIARQSSQQEKQNQIETQSTFVPKVDANTNSAFHAVKSTNAQTKTFSSQGLGIKVKHCEEAIRKQREGIIEDCKQLIKLKNLIGDRKENLKASEIKLKEIAEQLEAVQKIVSAHKNALLKMTEDQKNLSLAIQQKKAEKQKLEAKCLMVGKKAYGDSYKLPIVGRATPAKRKLQVTAWQSAQKRKKIVVEQQLSRVIQTHMKPKMSNDEIAQEKARLQKLEQEIAAKLSLLRGKAQSGKEAMQKMKVKSVSNNGGQLSTQSVDKTAAGVVRAKKKVTSQRGVQVCKNVNVEDGKKVATKVTVESTDNNLPLSDEVKQRVLKLQTGHENRNPFAEFSVPAEIYDLNVAFVKHIALQGFEKVAKHADASCLQTISCYAYKSPLLHCRSYRFSPYFRIGGNQSINSATYANKIKPFNILCRFDLTGTCNDEKCVWQHRKDYIMSSVEVLSDIVSYCPQVVGEYSEGNCLEKIGGYVESLLKSSQDKMTLNELSLLMVGRVNDSVAKGPPHYIFTEPRHCIPTRDRILPPSCEATAEMWTNVTYKCGPMPTATNESVEVRYFDSGGEINEEMELSLLKDPHAVDLWLALAERKLKGGEGDQNLDLALNVLSRALDSNRGSSKLWLQYLKLYSQRDDCADLSLLAEKAVEFAPCPEIWWEYLRHLNGFEKKCNVSEQLLDWLRNSDLCAEEKSHLVLEVILYRVHIHVSTGRHFEGVRLMELAIGKDQKKSEADGSGCLHETLTSSDRCVAWLSYIHLLEFDGLPAQMYPLTDSSPGRIVCKEPFLLPWKRPHVFKTSLETILANFKEALRKCFQRHKLAKVNTMVCLPLYRNLIALELARNRYDSALEICRQLLKAAPSLEELWVILANIYFQKEDFEMAQKVLHESLTVGPATIYLRYVAAKFEFNWGKWSAAEDIARTCAKDLFEWEPDAEYNGNSFHLFRKLLGLPIDLGVNIPRPKNDSFDNRDRTYLWLNYCILVTVVKGSFRKASEAFELALTRVSQDHVHIIWSNYICFKITDMGKCPESRKQSAFDELWSLVKRCLRCAGCRKNAQPQSEHCKILSSCNLVVDHFLSCVSKTLHQYFCEQILQISPYNSVIALRLLRIYVANEDFCNVHDLCKRLLEEYPQCLLLWEIAFHLAYRKKKASQVRHLYEQAVRALPYNSSLWRNYVIFEVAEGQTDNAVRLVRDCNRCGIQLGDFINTLVSSER